MDDILAVDKLFPNHPLVYIYLAQAYLGLNDPAAALENALIGFNLDLTSLPAYLTLAKVYLANQDLPATIHYIDIYLIYAPQTPMVGRLKPRLNTSWVIWM